MRVIKTNFRQKLMRYFLILCSVFLMSACASSWSAKVTTFQRWPAELYEARYSIVPNEVQKNSLEFQAVADSVRVALGAVGLVEGGVDGRLVVELSYGNPLQKEWVERYVDPYDPFVYGSPFSIGLGGGFGRSMHFRGMYYSMPHYVSMPVDIYSNTLKVVIKDKEKNMAEVFNVTAINKSETDNLFTVIPLLAKAAFNNFPGLNGQVEEVRFK